MDGLVIMRAGHYFIPDGGSDGACQGATVAYVFPRVGADLDRLDIVNLRVLQHDAEEDRHLEVPVITIDTVSPWSDAAARADLGTRLRATHDASFHFTAHCPWGR